MPVERKKLKTTNPSFSVKDTLEKKQQQAGRPSLQEVINLPLAPQIDSTAHVCLQLTDFKQCHPRRWQTTNYETSVRLWQGTRLEHGEAQPCLLPAAAALWDDRNHANSSVTAGVSSPGMRFNGLLGTEILSLLTGILCEADQWWLLLCCSLCICLIKGNMNMSVI